VAASVTVTAAAVVEAIRRSVMARALLPARQPA
jgi:hypothetical protein